MLLFVRSGVSYFALNGGLLRLVDEAGRAGGGLRLLDQVGGLPGELARETLVQR